jgi:hypothetical protein
LLHLLDGEALAVGQADVVRVEVRGEAVGERAGVGEAAKKAAFFSAVRR